MSEAPRMRAVRSSEAGALRIGHFIGSLRIGGAERQVVNLLNEMSPGQCVLITLSSQPGPLAAGLRADTRIVSSPVRWRTLPCDILRLARKLRGLNLDVLQTHMFWPNFTGVMAGKLAGIPLVVTTEHGRREPKADWARLVEKQLISRLADVRICVSEDLRKWRNLMDGVPLEKLCMIPNGTPKRDLKVLENRSPVVIGTLGRMIETKDYSTLIKAAELLREQGLDFRLVIVGDGKLHDRLVAEIRQRRLDDFVELPGFSTDAEAWLEQFDIYAITSTHEGQPLSLLEAMAIGLPIVATRVGGIPGTIEDGKEALLVPPGDASAIAKAIASLVTDLDFRKSLGSAARERQIKEFSVSASLQRYLEVYIDALGRKQNRQVS